MRTAQKGLGKTNAPAQAHGADSTARNSVREFIHTHLRRPSAASGSFGHHTPGVRTRRDNQRSLASRIRYGNRVHAASRLGEPPQLLPFDTSPESATRPPQTVRASATPATTALSHVRQPPMFQSHSSGVVAASWWPLHRINLEGQRKADYIAVAALAINSTRVTHAAVDLDLPHARSASPAPPHSRTASWSRGQRAGTTPAPE